MTSLSRARASFERATVTAGSPAGKGRLTDDVFAGISMSCARISLPLGDHAQSPLGALHRGISEGQRNRSLAFVRWRDFAVRR